MTYTRFEALSHLSCGPAMLFFGRFPIHMSQSTCRAETNRANAQHSTGPKSSIGKLRSSQNSFQHGLYSKQLILPGEDAAEFDHLRSTLRDEHQPANTVEEILIDELAQHFWRVRRFRELEARALQPENLDTWCNNGLFALIQRSMASAERSFHKSLTALQRLQKARGFVPQINSYEAHSSAYHVEYEEEDQDETGFVPSDLVGQTISLPSAEHIDRTEPGFVPSDSIHLLLENDQEADFERLAA